MVGVGPVLALMMLSATPEPAARAPAASAPGETAIAAPKTMPQPKRARPLTRPSEIGAKWGVVTSLLRSPAHNRAVGGAPNSFHLHGRAIDIARRPGVRHADIEAAYRKAGYRLVESLDEGDHSHFAFALTGATPDAQAGQPAAAIAAPPDPCAAATSPQSRRRPDRWDGCADAAEPKPRLRPIEQPAS